MWRYNKKEHLKEYLYGRSYDKRPRSLNRNKQYKEHFTPTMGGCLNEVKKTWDSKQGGDAALFGARIVGSVAINTFTGIGKGLIDGVGALFSLKNPVNPFVECFQKEIHWNVGGTSREWRDCEAYFTEIDSDEDASSEGEYAEVTDVYKKDNFKVDYEKYPIFKQIEEKKEEVINEYMKNIVINEVLFEEKFEYTKFHILYMLTERFPPINETIKDLKKILPEDMYASIDEFVNKHKDDPITAIMHIWTQWTAVTKPINFALMIDSNQVFEDKGCDMKKIEQSLKLNLAESKKHLNYFKVLEYSIKFIRSVNYCIVRKCTVLNTEERKTYRGVAAKIYNNLEVNEIFRTTNFCCTSENKNIAKEFGLWNNDSVSEKTLICFKIPKGCFNAGKIYGYAWDKYKHQLETLIPPYTCCKLTKKKGNKLYVEVCKDNKAPMFEGEAVTFKKISS